MEGERDKAVSPETDAGRRPPQTGGGLEKASDRPSGQAYTAMPASQPPRRKSWAWALAAAGLGAALFAAGHLKQGAPPPPPGGAAASATAAHKIFLVTPKDLDVAATRQAKELAAAAGPAKALPADPAAGAAARPAVASLVAAPKEPPLKPFKAVMAADPAGVSSALAEGSLQLYTFHLFDNVDEDGDTVALSLDGVPLGEYLLTHHGTSLTVPLRRGEPHTLTVTATHDGVGGVTVGLVGDGGRAQSRVLAEGESDSFTLGLKDAP